MHRRYVHRFGAHTIEGNVAMRQLLGEKGANLAEMTILGIPVPPGFTLTTEACARYHKLGCQIPNSIKMQAVNALRWVEKWRGSDFGSKRSPLLLSVQSGSGVSLPGMADSILNLGLNDETAEALAGISRDPALAWDAYARLVVAYGVGVMGVDPDRLDLRTDEGGCENREPSPALAKARVQACLNRVEAEAGRPFPQDAMEQLWGAVGAMFDAWSNPRAALYRRLRRIPDDAWTAVCVQSMVFGNLGEPSGTGVVYSRNPATGEKALFGEFHPGASGGSLKVGTSLPITGRSASLEAAMPEVSAQLAGICDRLETHFKDMQDVQFAVERGRLFILRAQTGERSAQAATRIALDLVEEGRIAPQVALARMDPEGLTQFLAPVFDPADKAAAEKAGRLWAKGLGAAPGAASGRIALSSAEAERMASEGPVILAKPETFPEDFPGLAASSGVLTLRGGATSHAAVLARGMGKPCVCVASNLGIETDKASLRIGERFLRNGEWVSIDGTSGEVFEGRLQPGPSKVARVLVEESLPPEESPLYQRFARLMTLARETKHLTVRANADTSEEARVARSLGAEGIGLCRTERMFLDEGRLLSVQEMILAEGSEASRRALAKVLPLQRVDFEGIFSAMDGFPVTIRLLDPPIKDFLPQDEAGIKALSMAMGIGTGEIRRRASELREINPAMGHRGCRLAITNPEIYRMQIRAIAEAALSVRSTGIEALPEVMIPFVGTHRELSFLKGELLAELYQVQKEQGQSLEVPFGTMIEVPRAVVTADRIAAEAEFFSFGTNDLTQLGFGISHDDRGSFLPRYLDKKVLAEDPFETLDQEGIGELIRIAVDRGRSVKPRLKLGICGEHGGDPRSIRFFHDLGFDYVSCPSHRIPTAILASAQAALPTQVERAPRL